MSSSGLHTGPVLLCRPQVERELCLVDKTVEKTSFQQHSRSLGRDGRLPGPEWEAERYSGPSLSLTRAGRLGGGRSQEALPVSSRLRPPAQHRDSESPVQPTGLHGQENGDL